MAVTISPNPCRYRPVVSGPRFTLGGVTPTKATVTAEVVSIGASTATLINTLPEASGITAQEVLSDIGSGSVQIKSDAAGEPLLGHSIRIRIGDEVTHSFVAEQKNDARVTAEEESTELLTVSGRGPLSRLERLIVHPAQFQTDAVTGRITMIRPYVDRFFDWRGRGYTVNTTTAPWNAWPRPITMFAWNALGKPPLGFGTRPADWNSVWGGATNTQWIWPYPTATHYPFLPGKAYFLTTFTPPAGPPAARWYRIIMACPSRFKLWVNEVPRLEVNEPVGQLADMETANVGAWLSSGQLATIAIEVEWDESMSLDMSGLLFEMYSLNSDGSKNAVVRSSSQASTLWRALADPPPPIGPGWTVGAALNRLLGSSEALLGARGGSTPNFPRTFDDYTDSAGEPWERHELSATVGESYLDVLTRWADTVCDVRCDPWNAELQVYNYGTMGSTLSNDIEPGVNVVDYTRFVQ